MYSIIFKGKPNPKNPKLVKIEMVFFKTGENRISRILEITGYYKDWDAKAGCFISKTKECLSANEQLLELRLKYMEVASLWETQARQWTPLQWKYCFESKSQKVQKPKILSVLNFIESLQNRFKNTERINNGKVVTSTANSELYLTLKNSLTQFSKEVYGRSFHSYFFEDIDEQFFKDYALFIQKQGILNGNKGGIVNKLKSLRATINYANKAKIPGVDPEAYIPVQNKMQTGKTIPKTIPYEVIKRIEKLDLSKFTKKQQLHIDVFLFSFYTGGMCNVDVIHLVHKNFNNGNIVYERMKTTKEAKMPVIQKAIDIIDKYIGQSTGDYVLPILKPHHTTEEQRRCRVSGFSDSVNRTLKKVAKILKYDGKITWNAARGTYITKMIDSKLSAEIVAEHAGNSPEVIYKHYYKVTSQNEVSKKVNNILG